MQLLREGSKLELCVFNDLNQFIISIDPNNIERFLYIGVVGLTSFTVSC